MNTAHADAKIRGCLHIAGFPPSPLVSVIIIFLNAGKFLQEAIESVLGQTYGHWELLLVDDGSTDASIEISLRYVELYPDRVRYLQHEGHQNRGMSASRNLGIENTRGEYIAFLDADDVWLPQKLEKQVNILIHHPDVGLVVNPTLYWYEDDVKKPQPMALPPGRLPPGAWLPKMLASSNNAACPTGVMLRKNLAVRLGGFEASFRGSPEDQVMWCKITMNDSIYHDPECTALYRIHSSSYCNRSPSTELLMLKVRFYSWLLDYLKHHQQLSKTELLTAMVKSKFCGVLLELASQPFTETANGTAGAHISRMRKCRELARTYGHLLGHFYAGLLLVGAISGRVSSALSTTTFAVSEEAYNRGLVGAWKTLLRRFLGGIRGTLPRPVKRLARRTMSVITAVSTRARLSVGVQPISQKGGFDRGLPPHRYYLEEFLQKFSSDICGHCLEFQADDYTSRFGGRKVSLLSILDIDEGNKRANIIADLTKPNKIPSNYFDCIICTYVLHVILEPDKAIAELYRILKPGGVLLVAVPNISRNYPKCHEIWRFTPEGLHRVLAKAFGAENVTVQAYGNSLIAAGTLRGLIAHEFTRAELNYHDPDFAVGVFARAQKRS